MTNTDFHARRTELSNTFAAAGADLLDYMGCAGALAAIPNTQQYVVAGDIAAIRAQLDTVAPQRRMRHGDRPELDLYFGPEAGQARRWAALITSAGHGVLQEYGTAFEHAQPGQEVLEVMEILPAAANKAAEEGELPALPEGDEFSHTRMLQSGDPAPRYTPASMREYARQAIAADRASRQVANKAEVDLPMFDERGPFYELFKFTVGSLAVHDFKEADEIGQKFRALLATPPATTGASTDPQREMMKRVIGEVAKHDIAAACDIACDATKVFEAPTSTAFMPTVLTDERIGSLYSTVTGHNLCKKDMEACISFARAIEREVAAQAGQVAVPDEKDAEIARLRAELEKMWKARFMISQALHNAMVGNQSAWIEWKHGGGAEEAMAWIHNGLVGPGLIPDGKEAQPWFDANQDDRHDVPPCPALASPSMAQQAPAQAEPGWISVDDQEPPEHELIAARYWPYDNHENPQAVSGARYIDGTFYDDEGDELHPPSHWCRLPAFDAAATAQASTAGERQKGGAA